MFELPSGAEIQSIIATLKTGVGFFIPEIYLSVLFMLLIVIDLVVKGRKNNLLSAVTALGLAGAFYFIYQQHLLEAGEIFFGMYVLDEFALFFKYFFVLSGILAVLVSVADDQLNRQVRSIGEYYALIVAMVIGMIMMASSADLLMMFLSMELVGLTAYVLTGYLKNDPRSAEGALKYLVYGAVSSGLMVYGFSLIYGLTAETNIMKISAELALHGYDPLVMMLASLLILAGFGYKIGAVPFHFWSPDVYEGAPTPVTAYLSVGSKAAGFAILMRFFYVAIPHGGEPFQDIAGMDWLSLLIVISIASMIYGNVVALWQKNVKRLLAYSSIAHAGYALLGIIAMDELGTQATLFYLLGYLLMNIGAFYVVILISNRTGSENLEDYRGLGRKMPLAGAALTVFLISLVGLPPTIGFIGKLMIFSALLAKGSVFIWLALIGVMTSVISLYYYMLIPLNMYLRESQQPDEGHDATGVVHQIGIAVLMILTIYFGLFFKPLLDFAKISSSMLGMTLY
ncbi:MAG: NADH-quinone oxidoreductase subunit N [Chlorobium limicola]|jgi:NADH-quinone oxidoreductase subunit N|uniref:NADH-quinone oxidoreductase subunit N n=1 Tax=Chlorobium limicola (strain DSM 245 / NBRC 103803 / 6330) TaxID=290315 RepID=B3EIA3_CHLL2|nr:NADH-quinone oxidoreductase subunit N [Chlorobium limicola]ACD89933.1 proton-translocating NADH-quinone oxidoreductase, chain N [Chlorobium limicola DSM 245]NTV07421.1 NADH-quinone oxidoreductase subunit N [Chlorobium limicola]NTV19879.1 NADH-quinone oxidoreductase subunit N [Chlorobium limicola]